MQTIAIANQKGGTGKTSVAVHLATGAARAGRRTLLIDLDEQANTTTWLLGDPPPDGPGIAEALTAGKLGAEHMREVDGRPSLVLAPATPALSGADIALAAEVGGETILR